MFEDEARLREHCPFTQQTFAPHIGIRVLEGQESSFLKLTWLPGVDEAGMRRAQGSRISDTVIQIVRIIGSRIAVIAGTHFSFVIIIVAIFR